MEYRYSAGDQTGLLASIIITTYNRRDALIETLIALGHQTVAPHLYEIIVIDDGSPDRTSEVASLVDLPCHLKVLRQPRNLGISAGRNLGISNARGRYLILLSDDLIVPQNFVSTHIETLEAYPGCWVVGGIRQLDSVISTPFGRYLDGLEKSWEEARKSSPLAENIWEMSWPTARNLSLQAADLRQTGVFDEQFRTSCEDQDLAHEARSAGIRFLYNANITCLHNDQVADFRSYCRAQLPRTRDTALFCHKRADVHGQAPIARLNGPMSIHDGPALLIKKMVKRVLALGPICKLAEEAVSIAEQIRLPQPVLCRMYRLVIGLYIFRGWRLGLKALEEKTPLNDINASWPSRVEP